MLVFRTLPLAAAIGSPWREVAVSAISAGLVLFGIGVAINYNGLANRTANVVAGSPDRNPVRPSPRTDRYWGVLPLTLGLTGLFYFLPDVPVVTFIGLPLVVAYYVAMMRLAWIYTAPDRRSLGPWFWFMRAAAIPASLFSPTACSFPLSWVQARSASRLQAARCIIYTS